MATIGERLSEARKNFGLDIRSASEATKIRSDFLTALEDNQPERIRLADVYRIGFLRIYAEYLKLDADRLVAEFRTELSFKNTSGKGSHRVVSSELPSAGTDGENGVFQSRSGDASWKKILHDGGARLAVAVAAAVVILALLVYGGVKIFGGDGAAASESAREVAEAPAPDTQVYEFQVVSKVAQNVEITDRFGKGEGRAVLLNGPVSPDKPLLLKGRGVLEIRDGGKGNLEIRFPKRVALLASKNAREAVRFSDADKENTAFTSSADWWTADPYKEENR